ncbi:MAG: 16S rRNA (uracil(1498)-N(3))-methyltransferase [Anaerolineae bacterium]|nr:16S rRNA (uracil(1498)-N(3))-methyltransferase [Gloeobacterales cyanobacterium ES-bin-313]
MVRLFLEPKQFSGESATTLTPDQLHYLRKVLRFRPGDFCVVLDGLGKAWRGVFDGERLALEALQESPGYELPISVKLACAVPKGERWEWLLQKAVELGATEIVPLQTERSVVKPQVEKLTRWQAILREAAEQCERAILPQVLAPMTLADFLAQGVMGKGLICTARGERPSLLSQRTTEPLTVLSGPEGGFSATEIAQAQVAGFQCVSLGQRILRAETAPLVALSWIGAWFEGDGWV